MNKHDLAIALNWLAEPSRPEPVVEMIDTLLRRVEAGAIDPETVLAKLDHFCPDDVWAEIKSAARIAADEHILEEDEDDEDDDASWYEAFYRAMAAGLLSWLRGAAPR